MVKKTALPANRRRLLLCIYGAALLYYVLKQVYYALCIAGFPDQMVHLSYIIEMTRTPTLTPAFSTMPIYHVTEVSGGLTYLAPTSGVINYLMHPPLYYLLMALLGGVQLFPDGTAALSLLRLEVINILLSSGAVGLAFYLGYTRLRDRSPWVHAFYALAVATLPMLAYVGASVNNDNLAFLALVIFVAGLLRYEESRALRARDQQNIPDLKTYLLIGLGFLVGGLSKLTTGLMMALMLLAVLVMSIVKTRSLKLVANRNFLITLPCYLLFLLYELWVRRTFGSWQPNLYTVAPDYYFTTIFYTPPENRVPMNFLSYVRHFAGGMGYTWSSLYGHNEQVNDLMNNRVFGVVYWVPVALAVFAALRQLVLRKTDRFTLPVIIGFFGTMAYHFYSNWSGYPFSGYLGGVQARYYLAMIVPLALIVCRDIPPLLRSEKLRLAGRIAACVLMVCWLAGDCLRLVIRLGFKL